MLSASCPKPEGMEVLLRTLAKVNYRIHTDAIKESLIPKLITKQQANFIYANEADLLNMALFGITAKEWKAQHPDAKGNIRDEATIEQLIVLSHLESINSLLIRKDFSQTDRLTELNKVAIAQIKSLLGNNNMKNRLIGIGAFIPGNKQVMTS